ncbi:MAG: tetratricopeptide repeat protein [Desulfobulbus sp.]|jgi:TPR repeat protein
MPVVSSATDAAELKLHAWRAYYGRQGPVNHARALQLYGQAAALGDAEAQHVYGGMLYEGVGTKPDRAAGAAWLLKAAEQGYVSPESMAIVGRMYLHGQGVPQNYEEGRKWLTRAAEEGNMQAQNDLAYLYTRGLVDGQPDEEKALRLYEQAAYQGDVSAQANTGIMYATGMGTEANPVRGYSWLSVAAGQGHAGAAVHRNNLVLDMSWEELNQAQALSLDLYRQVRQGKGSGRLAPAPQEPSASP